MWTLSKNGLSCKKLGQYMDFSTKYLLLKNSRLDYDADAKKKVPAYKKEAVFHSKSLLAKQLKDNILFDDSKKSGLVVINKPFGLSLLPGETEDFSLTCALPELACLLDVPEISVIKSSGKYISGCTLLNTKGTNTAKHITHCFNRNRANRKLSTKYLAITNGIPRSSGVLETVDMTLESITTKKSIVKGGSYKEPVIHRKLFSETKLRQAKQFGKNKDKVKQIKRISVVADILARSRGNTTALVSIAPNGIEWNFICAYMANLLAPIIGDSLLSYRVKTVLGKAVKVDHQNSPVGYDSNYLSKTILGQLGITASEEIHLPLHLHHFRTHLSGFYGKEDLNVYAPVPKYFEESIDALQISFNQKELESLDTILEYNFTQRNNDEKMTNDSNIDCQM